MGKLFSHTSLQLIRIKPKLEPIGCLQYHQYCLNNFNVVNLILFRGINNGHNSRETEKFHPNPDIILRPTAVPTYPE